MDKNVNIIGRKFNRLIVIFQVKNQKNKARLWYCMCDCGGDAIASTSRLVSGNTKSCSCLQKEWAVRKNTVHGLRHTPEYEIWAAMKSRCYNPRNIQYANYGGRGIEVCEEWRSSFVQFFLDMGSRPASDYSIDRIDNSLGYGKSNCRWVDEKTQQRNRRNNHYLTFLGETYCISEWEERQNLPCGILWDRITRDSWSIERALTEPLNR